MTADEFRRWMKQLGLSKAAAAAALEISERQIAYYRSGEQRVPKVVELACAELKRQRKDER